MVYAWPMRRLALLAAVPALLALPTATAGATAGEPGPKAALVRAGGADRFAEVTELRFTFNVERPSGPGVKRSFVWKPRTGDVEMAGPDGKVVAWNRHAKPESWTEAAREADKAFINDTFWLSPPLHLSWADEKVRVEDRGPAPRPVGEGAARQVTVTFPGAGGYTPGDAYDLFVDGQGQIVGWHYRKGGAPDATLTTSFADHRQFGPLTIALEHRSPDGKFRLWFTDVSVKTAQKP
jgi:hypothetical protein